MKKGLLVLLVIVVGVYLFFNSETHKFEKIADCKNRFVGNGFDFIKHHFANLVTTAGVDDNDTIFADDNPRGKKKWWES
jgi:hypothetical protein